MKADFLLRVCTFRCVYQFVDEVLVSRLRYLIGDLVFFIMLLGFIVSTASVILFVLWNFI